MSACEITGDAAIRQSFPLGSTESWGRTLTWLQADQAIHVSMELIGQVDPEAWEFFTAKYELGEWCPHHPDIRHARLKEAP